MTLAGSLLLFVSLALQPEANLRVYNPHQTAVSATIDCSGSQRVVLIEAMDAIDAGDCAMASIDAPLPLTAFETTIEDGVESQRLLDSDASCEPFAIEAPLFGCRKGTAIVAVTHVAGAAYTWSVEGASVVSGHGTNRLVLTLGEGPSARVSATVTGACTGTGQAVISLRSPLLIETLEIPAATTNVPATIHWSYAGGQTPVSQLLSGDAFEAPVVLGGHERSYTWTPKTSGAKTVELRASHAPAISINPRRRRRAAGSSRAIATECPGAQASGPIQVRGCGTINVDIESPREVEAGSTFSATVFLRTGETVRWTVMNGNIVSADTSETVTVKAGDQPGELHLFAGVTAGPACEETAEATIAITERAVCATARPAVTLSVEDVTCNSATVRATFTGTPPFRGIWSDGAAFETPVSTITRVFDRAGSFTIRTFNNATCSGTVSEPARIGQFGPQATVAIVGSRCFPGARVRATFAGTPPFSGYWSDGEPFTTSETTLEHIAGQSSNFQIYGLRDARCLEARNNSNSVNLVPRQTVKLRELSFCTNSTSPYADLFLYFPAGSARTPYTVSWSDGGVSTFAAGQQSLTRTVVTSAAERAFTVTRVQGPECDADVDPDYDTAIVSHRATPRIDRSASDIVSCLGSPSKMRLLPGFRPDVMIKWLITSGVIVSGQGTPELTMQNRLTAAQVTVEGSFSDGRCGSTDRVNTVMTWPGTITGFTAAPETIKAGETARIRYVVDAQVESVSLTVQPQSRASALRMADRVCKDPTLRDCTIPYRDTHGAGPVDLTLEIANRCGTETRTIRLNIE